jgi:hypothetical protein
MRRAVWLSSVFTKSGKFAFVFSGEACGEIKRSKFTENGEYAFHCLDGTPSIVDNMVQGRSRFEIYIFKGARPIVPGISSKNNGVASLWRE